jgi:hypothetical protein
VEDLGVVFYGSVEAVGGAAGAYRGTWKVMRVTGYADLGGSIGDDSFAPFRLSRDGVRRGRRCGGTFLAGLGIGVRLMTFSQTMVRARPGRIVVEPEPGTPSVSM